MSGDNEQFERDFESFLSDDDSRQAALYRKLPQAEPDARLDAAVRAQAQRAIAATLARAPLTSRHHWMPVFGVAAVVALAVGFAFRLGPQLWRRPAVQPAASGESAPTAPGSPQDSVAPVAIAPPVSPAPPATIPAPAAPAPEKQKVDNAASRPALRAFPTTAASMRKVGPVRAEAKPAQPTPTMAAPIKALQSDAASAGAPAAQDLNATLYPEHWLANIRQMLRNDRREEALRSLAQFRKRYPDYKLPDDLRDLQ